MVSQAQHHDHWSITYTRRSHTKFNDIRRYCQGASVFDLPGGNLGYLHAVRMRPSYHVCSSKPYRQ